MPELTQKLYDELLKIARRLMKSERSNHTLQPTALVNEAYVRLAHLLDQYQSPDHLRAMLATAMRQVLVDHGRAKRATKRGAGLVLVDVNQADPGDGEAGQAISVVELNDAISELARIDELQARIAEMRLFAGMELQEIATVLGVSLRSAERLWGQAKLWLARLWDKRKGG